MFATKNDLSWNVISRDLTVKVQGEEIWVPGKKAQLRDDNLEVLGITGDKYTVFQNSNLKNLVMPLVDEGLLEVTNIGYLGKGEKVFIQATMSEAYKVVGEEHKGMITLLNSHNGSSALAVGVTDTRVICGNTFASALTDMDQRIRHTGDIEEQVLNITDVVNFVNDGMAKFSQAAELLSSTRCDDEMMDVLITAAFKRETVQARNTIKKFYRNGIGTEGKSLYDALNGVTQWATHNSNKKDGTRFASANFGSAAQVSRNFMNAALALV